MSRRFGYATVVSFAALSLLLAGNATAAPKTVVGTVGPGFTITLKLNGAKVTKLKAGVQYRFVINDRSSIHDFHLEGPGVDKVVTAVDFTGTKSIRPQAQEGHVHVRVRPARVLHARELQGRLTPRRDADATTEKEKDMSQTIPSVLEEATIQELRDAVRGEIVTPSDSAYEEARRIWNGAHDGRRPALVVRCAGAADVIAAVGFARSNDLTIAVRGGGHSIAGFSTGDNGIVIDLSPMNSVQVDPSARWVTVGGGAVWADVDHETQAHGLATTGGLVSSTGVAGFTLGGGIGWLMRKYGLACDNLVGADVVTADGRLVHASESDNAELFWGLRGGGGNFGIVTQFEFEVHPVGPIVYAGPIFYSADADGDLLRLFREWAPGASDDVTAIVNLTTAPPLPVIPEAWHGKKVAAFIATSAGPVEDGDAHVHDVPRRRRAGRRPARPDAVQA